MLPNQEGELNEWMERGIFFSHYLSGQDDGQSSQERDIPVVKSFDNVDDHDCICIPITEGHAGIGKDRYQHMLFHIERARVEQEGAPEDREPVPSLGQDQGHESADG